MHLRKIFLHYFLCLIILFCALQSNALGQTQEVSILMPIYNTQPYLQNTLDSVIHQTHGKNITLFIIDDGSNDGSREKFEDILKAQNNINYKLFYHEKNKGLAQTRIDLLAHVKATSPKSFILWLDSDDQFTDKEFIAKFVNVMNETDADICLFNFVIEYEDEKNGIKNAQGLLSEKVNSEKLLDYIYSTKNHTLAPSDIENLLSFTSLGWTKGYAPHVLFFEPDVKNYEDFVYVANLITAKKITAFPSNYKPIKYLRRDLSISGQRTAKTFSDVLSQLEKFKSSVPIDYQQKFKTEINNFLSRKLEQYRILLVSLMDTPQHPDITQKTLNEYDIKAKNLLSN